MKALIPEGNLLVLLFNGYGDAFLSLPVLRQIRRRSPHGTIYLACYEEQISTLFPDLDFQFIPGRSVNGQIRLDEDLAHVDFQQAVSFNAYYPSAADKLLFDRFSHTPRWGFCDASGQPLASLAETPRHMRDQYFEVVGWEPVYSLSDRQVFLAATLSDRCSELCEAWSDRSGDRFYALHLDSLSEKMWPVSNWLELISHIRARWQAWPLILGEEAADASKIEATFSFAHKLPSSAGIALHLAAVKKAEVFIGIDSIFAHVADSYQKPMVTLFGTTDPVVWGPVGPDSLIIQPDLERKMDRITLDKVQAAADAVFDAVFEGRSNGIEKLTSTKETK